MRYCKKCAMPDTRPHSIFSKSGECQACINHEKRATVDWGLRLSELGTICSKYRRTDGYYDCIIPVSGGKDSHFLTYIVKEKMKMNPLLVCVTDPFTHTNAGKKNLANLKETFNSDLIEFSLGTDLFRKVTKVAFEELGEPLRFVEAAIYTVPHKFSVNLNIPLVVWGENSAYEYGTTAEESYSAKKYIAAGHSAAAETLGKEIYDFWLNRGVSMSEMNAIIPPAKADVERVKPEPIFMSYFTPWDDERNLQIAKYYGFQDLTNEWRREGTIEDYAQIDSVAYMVHLWLKYPKFGFARVTDIVSRWIRKGKISREAAIKSVMENDSKLDQRAMEDFINFIGYTPRQFWETVGKYWNKELFEKVDDLWVPRRPPMWSFHT